MTQCLNFQGMRNRIRLNLSLVRAGLYAQLLADNMHDMVDAQIHEQIIWFIYDETIDNLQ